MPQPILIVEDDAAVRLSLADCLGDVGFTVLEAGDAHQALQLFTRRHPDLVLLDLGLAGADGMDVLRRMKELRPETPIIIVSGRTHINDAIEAFKAGAWDYVTKPIPSLDVFINAVRNCLTQTRLHLQVRQTQTHLYQLIQNLPVIIFIMNSHLEFEFLNQTTTEILGYSPQEIQESPKPFMKNIVPEDRKKFSDALRQCLGSAGHPFKLEFRFMHKKGYLITLQAQSISPHLEDEGARPDRVEGMITDVTRNSYLDKILLQNEKLNMLRTMTEEVAHEIRNPLVSLGGFARQLRSRYPEAIEAEVVLEECSRLERLVQRITAYLEPITVNLTRCDLTSSLAFIVRLLSSRLERKDIAVNLDTPEAIPPVHADQEFIHRIFIYLLGHGIDLVEREGKVTVTTSQSENLVHATVHVQPVTTMKTTPDRLLMPFEDDDRNLATCYRLVERLGGHLSLEHQDSGVWFTVSFPQYPQVLIDQNGDST